ncbi:MAG: hypothetical protein NTY19_05480 [Planctomycetota bacterium]|nr:hypothetical protein [Planctomycetota bacterium]
MRVFNAFFDGDFEECERLPQFFVGDHQTRQFCLQRLQRRDVFREEKAVADLAPALSLPDVEKRTIRQSVVEEG